MQTCHCFTRLVHSYLLPSFTSSYRQTDLACHLKAVLMLLLKMVVEQEVQVQLLASYLQKALASSYLLQFEIVTRLIQR